MEFEESLGLGVLCGDFAFPRDWLPLLMYLSIFTMSGGLVLLTVGADLLVKGAASLAREIGLSPLVIGLTVVSIGTSLPELMVSVDAALQGNEDLSIGNVVGSNISNIALILGLSALVHPLRVEAQVVRVDGPILVGVSILLAGLVQDGGLGTLDGLLLFVGVIAYVVYNVWAASAEPETVREEFEQGIPGSHGLWRDLAFLVLGLGALIGGARFLVDGAVHIARALGTPQIVIGLTVVAVGTSLPELATSVFAAQRGQGDIAIGNAVGSSIFNILGILGLTAITTSITTASLTAVELVVMIGVAGLVLPLLRSGFILSRREGGLLLLVYVGYVTYLFLGG